MVRRLFTSALWVLNKLAGFLVLIGMISGPLRDVSGFEKTELGKSVDSTSSSFINECARFIWEYPGVMIGMLLLATAVHYLVTEPQRQVQRKEFDKRREVKRQRNQAKSKNKK